MNNDIKYTLKTVPKEIWTNNKSSDYFDHVCPILEMPDVSISENQ